MTHSPFLARFLAISFLTFLFSIGQAAASDTAKVPDSVQILVPALPDSVTVQGKVVIVDFWASWCAPCKLSFPWMEQLYRRYKDSGLTIVAVSVDEDHNSALRFLKEMKPSFPVIYDSTGTLAKEFGLEAMPTSFIYNRDGRAQTTHRGFRPDDTETLETEIAGLLKKETTK